VDDTDGSGDMADYLSTGNYGITREGVKYKISYTTTPGSAATVTCGRTKTRKGL
jgi:hypothetical protein